MSLGSPSLGHFPHPVLSQGLERFQDPVAVLFFRINAELGKNVVLAFDPGNGLFNVRKDGAVKKTFGAGFADKPAKHGFVKCKGNGVPLLLRVGQPLERREKIRPGIDFLNRDADIRRRS